MNTYYFTIILFDAEGDVLGGFEPAPVDQVASVAYLDGGQIEFSVMLMGAAVYGVAMTTVETEFEWGKAVVHLPQAWEGETDPDDIGRVLSAAEGAMKQAAGLLGPTGSNGPDDSGLHGVQGPYGIDIDPLPDWPF